MAGHPQENSWTQQGQEPSHGAPGYGPVYEQPAPYQQQGQPPAYDQHAYDQQQGYQAPQGQQQAYQQPRPHPGQQRQAPPPTPPQQPRPPKPASGAPGFVASLFDFGFTSFVTPKIIKAIYALVAVWTLVWAVLLLFIGNKQFGMTGLLIALIVDPILILVSLGVLRILLEFFMVTFRMQEDLRALRERGGLGARAGGDFSSPGGL